MTISRKTERGLTHCELVIYNNSNDMFCMHTFFILCVLFKSFAIEVVSKRLSPTIISDFSSISAISMILVIIV